MGINILGGSFFAAVALIYRFLLCLFRHGSVVPECLYFRPFLFGMFIICVFMSPFAGAACPF